MGLSRHSGEPQRGFKPILAISGDFRWDPGGLREHHWLTGEFQWVCGGFRGLGHFKVFLRGSAGFYGVLQAFWLTTREFQGVLLWTAQF